MQARARRHTDKQMDRLMPSRQWSKQIVQFGEQTQPSKEQPPDTMPCHTCEPLVFLHNSYRNSRYLVNSALIYLPSLICFCHLPHFLCRRIECQFWKMGNEQMCICKSHGEGKKWKEMGVAGGIGLSHTGGSCPRPIHVLNFYFYIYL